MHSPTFFLFVPDCVTLFLITPVASVESFRSNVCSRSGSRFVAEHVGCFSSLQWEHGADVGAQVLSRAYAETPQRMR